MPNHYIFLDPGEKIFVLTNSVAGDSDNTHIVEIEFPTVTNSFGEKFHDPKKVLDYKVIGALDSNTVANITSGTETHHGDNTIDAFAKQHEAEINPGVEPWVSMPVKHSTAISVQEQVKATQETLKAFGAESAD